MLTAKAFSLIFGLHRLEVRVEIRFAYDEVILDITGQYDVRRLPFLLLEVLSRLLTLTSLGEVIWHKRAHLLMLHGKHVTPFPLLTSCYSIGLDLLCFKHTFTVSMHLGSLVERRQSMWILHVIWLGKFVEISLTESKGVIVLEFVLAWNDILRSRLFLLLTVGKSNL